MQLLSDNAPVLKLPYRGAPQTVGVMKHAALVSQSHFPVRLMAEEVCSRIGGKDYTSEALACLYFLESRSRYMRDPRTVELVRAPYVVVQEILHGKIPSLDCDDMAAFLGAMLLQTGAEVRFATVAFRPLIYRGQKQFSHVFTQCREPRTGAWLSLDPVAGERTPEMLNRVVQAAFWPVA